MRSLGTFLILPLTVVAVVICLRPIPRPQGGVELGLVVREIEQLDAMRASLARGFGSQGVAATRETFVQVCRPVAARAQQLASENGWVVQQLAEKYRNPNNALDSVGERAYRLLLQDSTLMGLWIRTTMRGEVGARYYRRIVVEQACLACHGPEGSRPDFVRQGYPQDKAFDFQVGDLRGIYSVFVPDRN